MAPHKLMAPFSLSPHPPFPTPPHTHPHTHTGTWHKAAPLPRSSLNCFTLAAPALRNELHVKKTKLHPCRRRVPSGGIWKCFILFARSLSSPLSNKCGPLFGGLHTDATAVEWRAELPLCGPSEPPPPPPRTQHQACHLVSALRTTATSDQLMVTNGSLSLCNHALITSRRVVTAQSHCRSEGPWESDSACSGKGALAFLFVFFCLFVCFPLMEKCFGGRRARDGIVFFFSFSVFIFYSGLSLRDILSLSILNIIEKWTSRVP